MGMFMSSTLEASVFIGNYSENSHSIKIQGTNLTLKQMCDISGKLIVGQSDEFFGVTPINWEVWTEHPHTSHILALACTHFNVARDIGSKCLARITSCHQAFGCAFDLILCDPLLCTLHCLSHSLFHCFSFFIFLVGWFDEKSHVLPRMRSWALWQRTILSQEDSSWKHFSHGPR